MTNRTKAKRQHFGQHRTTSQLIVDPFSRRGQALQGVAVRKCGEVLLVLVLSLRQQLLPLHEGVVELFVRIGEDHLIVELCHHRLSQRNPGIGRRGGVLVWERRGKSHE